MGARARSRNLRLQYPMRIFLFAFGSKTISHQLRLLDQNKKPAVADFLFWCPSQESKSTTSVPDADIFVRLRLQNYLASASTPGPK